MSLVRHTLCGKCPECGLAFHELNVYINLDKDVLIFIYLHGTTCCASEGLATIPEQPEVEPDPHVPPQQEVPELPEEIELEFQQRRCFYNKMVSPDCPSTTPVSGPSKESQIKPLLPYMHPPKSWSQQRRSKSRRYYGDLVRTLKQLREERRVEERRVEETRLIFI